MSNPSRRKGSDAEIKLLAWIKDKALRKAVRNPPAGSKDIGDLTVFDFDRDDIVIEVKNWENQTAAINAGLKELDVEKANAGSSRGVLVVKRTGKGDPGEWLAVRLVKDDPEIGQGGL